MPLEEPAWWYGPADSMVVRLLSPVARFYGWRAAARLTSRQPYRSRLPVICAGNFTAGGTGKTPLTLHILQRLASMGETPAVLTRGYGGKLRGPHWIDAEHDTAKDVGDEPLLLARIVPTLIARDRRAGAIAIETSRPNTTVIVMDDGLQNPRLAKDLTIAVVDARRGIGNGHVIPAGPLRAPLGEQLARTDAILVNVPPGLHGTSVDAAETAADAKAARLHDRLRHDFPGPVLAAHVSAVGDLGWLAERPVVAFAGIANPKRFFSLIEQAGGQIAERVAFKDHHPFTDADAERLLARARALSATLVTTEKDRARLAGMGGAAGELLAASHTIAIALQLNGDDGQRLDEMLRAALATGGYRD
ncbi:MAG: tetraacyldisaccharide 4'-kinase [Hyphomicrobiaceae bacterium]|nr:tetraacyldisaccharide 4'-kinase [Hyphomicrobiaceae bacterium]